MILYGRPPGAPKTRYLDWLYKKNEENEQIYTDLKSLLKRAVEVFEVDDDWAENGDEYIKRIVDDKKRKDD